jgi:hypothetical protein
MLPSQTVLANNILALSPTTDEVAGITSLVGVLADFMNQVQGGPDGMVGIFTLDNPTVIAALSTLAPVNNNSWVAAFSTAFLSGVTAGVITPSTVTNSAWIGSGDLDTETSPSAASTITTLSAFESTLMSGLDGATAENNPPQPFAAAFRDSTLEFQFECIGLGPPPTFTPIPIVIAAE